MICIFSQLFRNLLRNIQRIQEYELGFKLFRLGEGKFFEVNLNKKTVKLK